MRNIRVGPAARWYEVQLPWQPWIAHPGDRLYWVAIAWRVFGTFMTAIWCAGIIDCDEGDLWTASRWAPLGTEPRPWPRYR